jgi:chromosome segregation ATPase
LTQKVETITHIVGEIKHELEVLRSKTSVITLQITESTRKVT